MALQKANIGAAPNDGSGDSLRALGQKFNANVDDLNQSISTEGLVETLSEATGSNRLPVSAVAGAAAVTSNSVTGSQSISGISRSPAIRRSVGSRGPWGTSGNIDVNAGLFLTMEALSQFKAVQLIVKGQNSVGIQGFIGVSSILGDGFTPKAQDGTTSVAPTPLTWGTTDINDFLNPGGGKAYGSINDAVGTFAYPAADNANYFIGHCASDWLSINSLTNNTAGQGPICMARWFAPFNNTAAPIDVVIGGETVSIPVGNRSPGFRNRNGEYLDDRDPYWRNLRMTYNTQPTQLGNATPTGLAGTIPIPSNNAIYTNAILRFLYDIPTITMMTFGDSHLAGYVAGAGTPWGANGMGGWPAMLRNSYISASIPINLTQDCMTTDKSINFHNRADWAIRNRMATHYLIQIRSINDNSGQSASSMALRLSQAIARTNELAIKAYASGAQPVIIQPWSSSSTDEPIIRSAAESMRAQGISVIDIPAIICLPDRITLKPEYVVPSDTAHYNKAAHEAIELHVRTGGYIR